MHLRATVPVFICTCFFALFAYYWLIRIHFFVGQVAVHIGDYVLGSSRFGTPVLLCRGYTYGNLVKSGENINWRCSRQKQFKCRAKACLRPDGVLMLRGQHCHWRKSKLSCLEFWKVNKSVGALFFSDFFCLDNIWKLFKNWEQVVCIIHCLKVPIVETKSFSFTAFFLNNVQQWRRTNFSRRW